MPPVSSPTSSAGGSSLAVESGRRTVRNLAFGIFLGFAFTLTVRIFTQSNAVYASQIYGEEFDQAITMPTTRATTTTTNKTKTTTVTAMTDESNTQENNTKTEATTTTEESVMSSIESSPRITVNKNVTTNSATIKSISESAESNNKTESATTTEESTPSSIESSPRAKITVNKNATTSIAESAAVSRKSNSPEAKSQAQSATPPTSYVTSSHTNKKKIAKAFERQDGVVIATKIHSTNHLYALEQMLCLLHYAYNNRVLYDVILFSTYDINQTLLEPARNVIAPANLTFVVDSPPLVDVVNGLEPYRRDHLLKRCNKSIEEIDWYDYCQEDGKWYRLAYTWQAEFRSLHLWTHPALKPYKYMMWLDTDAFCTRVWDHDPVAYMINNDMALMFDNFPQGSSRGPDFQERFVRAFNRTLCNVALKDGKLVPNLGGRCPNPGIHLVHGFMHISSLEFFRSEPVMKWARTLIGDTKFSRKFDDQIAVTAPAAVLASNRTAEFERGAGMKLNIFHNYKMDGKTKVGGFRRWWRLYSKGNFSEAVPHCKIRDAGR